MNHGLGHVYALLVVAHQASPSREPTEGAFDDPTTRQHLEARLFVDAADDLDDELVEGGLIHELRAVVRAVGEQMLEPRPAFAHRVQDHLCPGAIRYVGGREVEQQQPTVGVYGDMALPFHGLLARVEAALCTGGRGFDRLTVDHASGRAGLSPLAPAFRRRWQQRSNLLPFRVGEIGRVTPRLPLDTGHPASGLSCSYTQDEPQMRSRGKPLFQTDTKDL